MANYGITKTSATIAAGDIEIGAVEVKNASDDTRATVETKGTKGALAVEILDGSGNQVVAFGGAGTEYADGAARGTATGRLAMGDDGVNIQSLKCDASGVLAIQDNGGSITIDGSIGNTAFGVNNGAGAAAVNIQDGGNTITVDGSVTVGNGAGASAVNIQDGGNTITIDGAISNTAFGVNNGAGAAAVNIQDGGNTITIDGSISNTAFGVNNGGGGAAVNVQDGGNTLTVDTTQLPAALGANGGLKIEGIAGGQPVPISGTVTAGQEYADGAARGSAIGVLAMGDDGVNIQSIKVDANGVLAIQDNGGTITIDGSIGNTAFGVNNGAGAAAVNIQDGGNTITVDGSVGITGTPTVDTELPAAAALADNTANPSVPGVGAYLMAFDGTNWDRVQTGAVTGGALKVDGSAVTQPISGAISNTAFGVNNGAGASAVNIQDGGNSITIDTTQLPAALAAGGGLKIEGVAGGVAVPVSGTFFQATQPVSGTVTANQGTANTVANGWPTKITDGTNTAGVDAQNGLYVSGKSAAGAAPASNPVYVSGIDGGGLKRGLLTDATGKLSVIADTELPAAAALADGAANPTTPTVGAAILGYNTATWDRIRSDGNNVDGDAVKTTGVLNVEGYNMSYNGTNWDRTRGNTSGNFVQGPTANGVAAAGNPIQVGGVAASAVPTAVAAGQTVRNYTDLVGRIGVFEGSGSPSDPVSVNATASGNTTIIAAPGVGVRLYIRRASVHNRAGTTRLVALTDGAGGTIRWRAQIGANGGGSLIDFGSRGMALTANTALVANLDAAGNIDVNVTSYYTAA